ncbi:MAG: PKD domain-containing protein [Flavobacteriales bacterium]|jgi:hypothetical protein|nr:PKD domain-containing protein [Flavobacteriales bacterium]
MILYKNIKHRLIDPFKVLFVLTFVFSLNNYFSQKISIKQVKVNDFEESSFAPFVKDGWLYFSSNKKRSSLTSIQTEDGELFFDLYKAEIKEQNKLKAKHISLGDSVNRMFNETSSCIHGNTLYFSSNSFGEVKKKKIGKYGIFLYNLDSTSNQAIQAFKYNDKHFNVAHPTINEDGTMLVFSSDNIAGEGKSDLYFCKYVDGEWATPQNLGININTEEMETFPSLQGRTLYFSSDRKNGKGGLDIYASIFDGKSWSVPKLLPEPINTKYDDFGYTLNPDFKSGYFSSNRTKKRDGIFYFEYDIPVVNEFYQQELYFCYTFEETEMEETDSLKFQWDLGDGTLQKGRLADHCFSDTGTYNIEMSVIDKYTGTIFENVSSYQIIIDAHNQPVIDLEDIKPGVVKVFVNKKWSNQQFTDYYWIVDGDFVFADELTLKFKDKSEINVKLVIWDKESPESVTGVERIVYK